MAAITLFVIPMSMFFFFFGENGNSVSELKTDVLQGSSVSAPAAETPTQQTEQDYRRIVGNQDDPLYVMKVDGTIAFSSPNVEGSLGYKDADLQNQIFFLMINPDDLSTFLNAFGKVVQDKTPITMIGPFRLKDKSGQYHLEIGSLFPILDQGEVKSIAISTKELPQNVNSQDNGKTKKPAVPKGKKILNDKSNDDGRFLADHLF